MLRQEQVDERAVGGGLQKLTSDRVRFRLERVLRRVLHQLFPDVLRCVFMRTGIAFEVANVSVLLNKLHLGAPQAERAAFSFLHFVLEEVMSDVIFIRRRMATVSRLN